MNAYDYVAIGASACTMLVWLLILWAVDRGREGEDP